MSERSGSSSDPKKGGRGQVTAAQAVTECAEHERRIRRRSLLIKEQEPAKLLNGKMASQILGAMAGAEPESARPNAGITVVAPAGGCTPKALFMKLRTLERSICGTGDPFISHIIFY